MNKPLENWTLGEVKAECERQHGKNCCIEECPLGGDTGCRLMGYEKPPCYWNLEMSDAMAEQKKPRLAEILGVEVGEKFGIDYPNRQYDKAFISEDGTMRAVRDDANSSQKIGGQAVCYVINHPESIIRRPKLTEQELTICNAVGAKWITLDEDGTNRVCLWCVKPSSEIDGNNGIHYYTDGGEGLTALVERRNFPTIKPGDCMEVSE